MPQFIQQLRFALRQLRKSPGFAAMVVLTLALGIAATTTIFSLVDAVLLRPLDLPESDRLVSLDTLERVDNADSSHGHKGDLARSETSYPNFFDWRSQNRSFSSMASYTTGGAILAANATSPARALHSATVSSDFFSTLGVNPELGRGFTRQEEIPGNHVVVLSHDVWKTEFAADPNILGKTVVLSDVNYTVVGVMPASFEFPITNTGTSFWINIGRDGEGQNSSMQQRGWNQLSVVARLKPGVTLAQAKAEMDTLQQGLATRYPDDNAKETAVSVVPQLEDIVSDVQTPLRILFSAVACLLLIVCANVAGLMLTRTSQRRGELALRSALGATRGQLLRQLLVESTVLSVAGGLLGLAATSLLLKLAPTVLPPSLPRVHSLALNSEVLSFSVAVSLLTGLLFGVIPAWRASQQDPATALAEGSRSAISGRRHFRLQSVLVVSQTALGLILLVGAGLLIQSFNRIVHVDPGFNPSQVLTFRISMPLKRYDVLAQSRFFHQLLPQLQALPGVQKVTAAYPMPLTQGDINISFSIVGQPSPLGQEPSARVSLIAPDFFQTLQVPLLQGRFFLPTEQDAKGRPVAIVNQAFAKRFFPAGNALGQHIVPGLSIEDTPPAREIVGIVGNVKRSSLTEVDRPEYYIPYEQAPTGLPTVALRVTGDPNRLASAVRAEVAKLDRALPVYRLQTYKDDLARITAQERFQTLLIGAFAAAALLLAALGLYAVLSYMVTQRTPELGLRLALGASRSHVLQLLLVRGMILSGVGLTFGIAAASLLTRFVSGLLFQVKALDAFTFTTMALVLLAVSAVASLIPAWRAAMLDPIKTLRNS
jgi:predicted permease